MIRSSYAPRHAAPPRRRRPSMRALLSGMVAAISFISMSMVAPTLASADSQPYSGGGVQALWQALPACVNEDGSGGPLPCKWEAKKRGDGQGQSFWFNSSGEINYVGFHADENTSVKSPPVANATDPNGSSGVQVTLRNVGAMAFGFQIYSPNPNPYDGVLAGGVNAGVYPAINAYMGATSGGLCIWSRDASVGGGWRKAFVGPGGIRWYSDGFIAGHEMHVVQAMISDDLGCRGPAGVPTWPPYGYYRGTE